MIETRPPDLKSAILERLDELDIFKRYCKNFIKVGQKFRSEFRKDPNPSCYIINYNGRLIYKDFGESESYDCFGYVERKYNLNFKEALECIYNDFKVDVNSRTVISKPKVDYAVKTNVIRVKFRDFTKRDLNYWKQYNINKQLLNFYNVYAIEYYITNHGNDGYYIKYNTPIDTYAYYIGNKPNGVQEYKIYRPHETDNKWRNNCSKGSIQGRNQLVKNGCRLFITSSLKDVMALRSINFRFNAIAPSSENIIFTENVINNLSSRFLDIYTLMNNDLAGTNSMNKYRELYGFNPIILPFEQKDPSDIIKAGNIIELSRFLHTIINT